jgi:hypothetical protein
MYICSHIENMIFYKLATCISWAVFGGTIGGQHRQVSLYLMKPVVCTVIYYDKARINIYLRSRTFHSWIEHMANESVTVRVG